MKARICFTGSHERSHYRHWSMKDASQREHGHSHKEKGCSTLGGITSELLPPILLLSQNHPSTVISWVSLFDKLLYFIFPFCLLPVSAFWIPCHHLQCPSPIFFLRCGLPFPIVYLSGLQPNPSHYSSSSNRMRLLLHPLSTENFICLNKRPLLEQMLLSETKSNGVRVQSQEQLHKKTTLDIETPRYMFKHVSKTQNLPQR